MKPILLLAVVSGGVCFAQPADSHGLDIPAARPRLWWNAERLAQAQAWHASTPFTPAANDYAGQAFRYQLTGETRYARAAIDYALSLLLTDAAANADDNRGASDGARWHGENLILIYDWCYDQMTPDERQTLLDRWNLYFDRLRKKAWGGPDMPQSNYFWGYLRNELLWAIATWHENPMAPVFLEDALKTRWQDSFLPHAAGAALGGVAQEGSQYGRYILGYPVVSFITAGLMGRQPFHETAFFKSAVYALLYATTPAPTTALRNGIPSFEIFPFGDDQFFRLGRSAEAREFGDFMSAAANLWKDRPIGGHARQWLKLTGAARAPYVRAVEQEIPDGDSSTLPLDYYAPGPGVLYSRSAWGPAATLLHLQLGESNTQGGHEHRDLGNWQLWRNGRWLSRETAGYAGTDRLAGYAGAGVVEANAGPPHNVLLFNGKGMAEQRNGAPLVKRLESRPDYAYAAVDLTPVYRNDRVQWRRPERDNPVVARVEREFVFIRPLEALVIFDRVRSNGDEMPAETVTRTFLAHFEREPAPDGPGSYVGANGAQVLRVTTLLPAEPVSRVVAEGGAVGQYRLEVDAGGAEQSYFLHVLQGREDGQPNLDAQVSDTGEEYEVTLWHPTLGAARLVFRKGAETSGGGIAFSSAEMPAATEPFLDRVQRFEMSDEGPRWEGGQAVEPESAAAVAESPAASSASVALTVHGYAAGNGPADLASNAVPFKPGVLTDVRNLRLLDGGNEIPIAAKVLALWPADRSIRSVLLQFAAASDAYTLEIGTPRATPDLPLTAVTWDLPKRVFTLPPSYLCDSLIFWEQKPLGSTGFPDWDRKQVDFYRRIENPGTAACVRDDQYYDAISTTYQLYARTGELKYLVNARRWALHHRRDQIWLEGANAGRPRCSGAYLNNTRYTFPQGLVSDWLMFGDEEARRVSGLVVDNFYMRHADSWYYKAPNARGMWTEREAAFALIGILAQYEATGNDVYLNKVRDRVASLRRMQVENGRRAWVHNLYDHDPSEGCAQGDYGSSPWMSGLLLEAIVKYHKLTGDPAARESILMAVDDLMARYLATANYAGKSFIYLGCSAYGDGAPDLDNLISHAYAYAYKLTGKSDYLRVGGDLFQTSVRSGATSTHKHYDQQFRSSGLFVGYLGAPAAATPASVRGSAGDGPHAPPRRATTPGSATPR